MSDRDAAKRMMGDVTMLDHEGAVGRGRAGRLFAVWCTACVLVGSVVAGGTYALMRRYQTREGVLILDVTTNREAYHRHLETIPDWLGSLAAAASLTGGFRMLRRAGADPGWLVGLAAVHAGIWFPLVVFIGTCSEYAFP